MSVLNSNLLTNASTAREARTARVSSWDHSGKNEDAWAIGPGETAVLADLKGPGAITHLWFVQTCRRILGPGIMNYKDVGVAMSEVHNALGLNWEVMDEDYYRKVLIKMYWDDQETPSVVAPLGDFFCLGNSMAANFQSLPFTVSVKPGEQHKYGGAAAFNCYLTMPFNSRAKIVVENQNDVEYFQYFYIDYELYPKPQDELLYFHAHWKRENPTDGWGPNLQTNSKETQIANLDGKGNYVVLETEGKGNFIGMNHSVTHFQGTWWGEGDDMIWIDDDPEWPPSIHGTGGEDYLAQGWGMQKNAWAFCGSIIHEEDVPNTQVSYRWHLSDPVRFNKKIKVTLEHGHANHLSDDWASTAYWYQTLPSPKLDILPMKDRLVRRPVLLDQPPMKQPDPSQLTEVQREMHKQHEKRYKDFIAQRAEWVGRRVKDSAARSVKNTEMAEEVRQRYLKSLS